MADTLVLDYKPKILKTRFRFVMEGLWILLMAIGAAVLWLPYVFRPTGAILAGYRPFCFLVDTPLYYHAHNEKPFITTLGPSEERAGAQGL